MHRCTIGPAPAAPNLPAICRRLTWATFAVLSALAVPAQELPTSGRPADGSAAAARVAPAPRPVDGPRSVWIVDQAAGPGSHFTSLLSAATSTRVRAGHTLRVRSGNYAAPTLTKGINVVPETWGDSVVFRGAFTIANLPAGERCALKRMSADLGVASSVRCDNNAGSVHCEEIDVGVFGLGAFAISSSVHVTLNTCDASVVTVDRRSLVLMNQCRVVAALGPQPHALLVDQSEVILADSIVLGSGGAIDPFTCAVTLMPGPAVELRSGSVTITGPGGSALGGTAETLFCGTVAAGAGVFGSGQVTVDPATPEPHNGVAGPQVIAQIVPDLAIRYPAPGGTISGRLWGPPQWSAIVRSSPPPAGAPTPLGSSYLWIDPNAAVVSFMGVIGGSGLLALQSPFPTTSSGPISFQAELLDPIGNRVLSTGAVIVINQQ